MGIIAVAGGTGSVGRTIVDALVARATHKVIILSRTDRPPQDGVSLQPVNYQDVDATARALEAASIDTVICAFGIDNQAVQDTQLKLIKAADRSACTRRFVVSSFDLLYKEEHVPLLPWAQWALDTDRAIAQTGLHYTRIVSGPFLDYYGVPHWKSYLKPFVNAVNVGAKWAAIPGDGTTPVSFVTSQDMARLVARLMDEDGARWPRVAGIAGQTRSFGEILAIAERVRGGKFSVVYNSLDRLRSGHISFPDFVETGLEEPDPSNEWIFATFNYLSATGNYFVQTEETLDARFPEVRITTAEEVIEESWGGR
ncbi:NAD(P)-binding protein [Aspergillus campestris IBT 28561]|uniref:NAD(P)-binding protein n=1 Tax=Aspergillus campestris (strain IBT 28561) TaxID=1392248 RepID=A0A2I1D0R6_ASPC2|nr:NAD(P)-binding protein [Aspergillus campestris IBT 28561]PKY03465.1 NAD(P)-binding protein [Aspergillus campestris IBT 28561]